MPVSRPKVGDITDAQMARYLASDYERTYEAMALQFDSAPKVIERVLERMSRRGLIDYGVSLRTAWLTDEGKALLP